MKSDSLPIVAAFDFDGTITYRDTLVSFLFFCDGFLKASYKLTLLIPTLMRYLFGKISRQKTKECVLNVFFSGMAIQDLRVKGEEFARKCLHKHLKPEALAKLKWHQERGHRCILVSASLDIYLEPWSKMAGFKDLICSRLQVTSKGNVTGNLEGLNCWGEEKTRRLSLLLGPRDGYILYAYGDSRGDQEMLAEADYPFYRKMNTGAI